MIIILLYDSEFFFRKFCVRVILHDGILERKGGRNSSLPNFSECTTVETPIIEPCAM